MSIDYSTNPPTEHHIHWGGVVKGAAIVAGIAVAAVVGFWLFTAASAYITGAITTNASASALAAGTHSAAVATAHGVGWAAGSIGHILGAIPGQLVNLFGLSGQHFAQAAAVNHIAGIGGAAIAGSVATHAAAPYLQHGHYVDVEPVVHAVNPTMHANTDLLTSQGLNLAPVVPMHEISHIAHHAAEHADEHAAHSAAWADRVAPRSTTYASFTDNVRAAKEERKNIQPAANFTEQLNADRANLDAALAK